MALTVDAETEGQAFEVSDSCCPTAGFDFLATFLATFAAAAPVALSALLSRCRWR
jgi:hypothetical protein